MDKTSLGQQCIELLKQSIIVQALITLGVIGVVLYMALLQLLIPEWMLQLVWVVVGFYFGSKVGFGQGHAHGVKAATATPPDVTPAAGQGD